MASRQRKGGPPGDMMDCLHKIESIGRANQVPQTAQIAFTIHNVPLALPRPDLLRSYRFSAFVVN